MEIKTDFYKMVPYEHLLYIEAFFAWDERVAKDYLKDLKRIAYKFYHDKPWALLIDRSRWELHTPEAEKLISQMVSGRFKTPLSHLAVVAGKSEIKKWQVGKIVQEASRLEIEVFDNIQDAKEWLASSGFDMTPV
ncbi:MAG: hypothetical protein HUN04_02810 [Desulfobacter sp.]|nr:MAG: hypothetical protein HUN04_02810 [Desulfobacter sp.]